MQIPGLGGPQPVRPSPQPLSQRERGSCLSLSPVFPSPLEGEGGPEPVEGPGEGADGPPGGAGDPMGITRLGRGGRGVLRR